MLDRLRWAWSWLTYRIWVGIPIDHQPEWLYWRLVPHVGLYANFDSFAEWRAWKRMVEIEDAKEVR